MKTTKHSINNYMNKLDVIITGEPRSGTSLQMNIHKALDKDIAGEEFPNRTPEQTKSVKNLNPMGFWEIPGVVIRGLREIPDQLDGKTIKIISSGAYPHMVGNHLYGTPPENYKKAVFCLRNPKSVSKSQTQLNTGVNISEKATWNAARLPINPALFIIRTGNLAIWLAEQSNEVKDKFLVVDYDKTLENPEKEIKRICEHIGIKYKKTDVVKQQLKRSFLDEWPDEIKEEGELADELYQLILNENYEEIATTWKIDRDEFLEKRRIESAKWVDTEFKTYRLINSFLWNGLMTNDKNVKDKLLKKSNFHDYTKSPFYSESDETYTVERSPDIGNLTRNLVHCKHPDFEGPMTHENFRALWIKKGRNNWK